MLVTINRKPELRFNQRGVIDPKKLLRCTTQKVIKRKMSFRAWKNIHLISYGTAILFVFHGIFMDPHLKNSQPDFFDGEKLLLEFCGLLLVVASVKRYMSHLKKT